jgi:hypothetical protein
MIDYCIWRIDEFGIRMKWQKKSIRRFAFCFVASKLPEKHASDGRRPLNESYIRVERIRSEYIEQSYDSDHQERESRLASSSTAAVPTQSIESSGQERTLLRRREQDARSIEEARSQHAASHSCRYETSENQQSLRTTITSERQWTTRIGLATEVTSEQEQSE